jgi:tetratricopeptide (TPR) repeat protein
VQPDLLAEHHVMSQLAADPALAQAMLTDLSPGQAEQALTVLARALALHDEAGQVIETALRADLTGLAIPAAEVAVQTSAWVGVLLAAALSDAPAALGDLIRIEKAMPYPSVSLATADLVAAQRIRRELPQETDKQTIASWADKCGVLLSQVGRPAEALPATQEAVMVYRELAAADADRYRPDLAQSLTNLGITFSELVRSADALPPTQEAVAIRRELAAADPDQYRPDLARSLDNLGNLYSELGLPPTQEVVSVRPELAAADADQDRPIPPPP